MFQLTTPTEMKLATFVVRTEKHGDDDVLAFSAGLRFTGANTFLDLVAPGLRESLYSAVEGQEQLPGVEPATPLLRCKKIDAVALDVTCDGWTLEIEHGIDEPMRIGGTKIDRFKVTPHEGGSVEVSMRVGSNDVDEDELGRLAGKLSQQISVRMLAPEKPADAIDGSVDAFKRDHPDATDIFAQGPDDETEGGDPDVGGSVLAADEPAKARRSRRPVLQ